MYCFICFFSGFYFTSSTFPNTQTLSAPPAVNEVDLPKSLDMNNSSMTLNTPSNRTETRSVTETIRMVLATPPTSTEVPNHDITPAAIGLFFPLAGVIGIAVHFCAK
ncbi:uncharacterized protein LOC131931343 isoform X2 [Physella acuta]|uniref:uncharacterized protein LOC131931343 isoform X2 n=1 Tax=Physella acuta TaxID=109671 RepID=UPI0027DD93F5|nr:uncharacterized protein LOC131931343 isoform X2 [Physella acuta]XP_059144099.1 uncharacterized protein LOC131931343 isoform X2 [Physella acuta]